MTDKEGDYAGLDHYYREQAKFTPLNPDWETPPEVFREIERVCFLKFDYDLCADAKNTKCVNFINRQMNILSISPYMFKDHTCFMNPPYARKTKYEFGIGAYVEKARMIRDQSNAPVVCLIPANCTANAWFDDAVGLEERERKKRNIELNFLQGRVKFLQQKRDNRTNPYSSMLVYFKADE